MKNKKNIIKIVVTAIIAVTLLASSTAVMTAATGSGYIETPQITQLKITDRGVEINWNKVSGAEVYRVYYKGRNGWTRMYDTTSTSYVDTDVERDCHYTYTVRCLNSEKDRFTSDYDHDGKMIQYSLYPYLTNAESTNDGVKLSWKKIDGVEKYRVFYYGRNGWTRMCDTASTSITDKDVESGYHYTYTVRAISPNGSEYISGYDSDGIRLQYIATPQITDVDGQNGGIKISWNRVTGAKVYRVYYKGRNGWTRMYDTTSTSYVDNDVEPGCHYTYTVRCLNSARDEFTSGYNGDGFKIYYVNTPKVEVESANGGVQISWNKVSGADIYRVYYKGRNGWTKLCDTASTSYIDTDVESGYHYRYTVRCLSMNKQQFTSGFDTEGKMLKYVAVPEITDFENTDNGVKISWNKVNGADIYRVYYKGRNGWTRMCDTTSTSYVDTDVASGTNYTYTVRCLNSDKDEFTSDYNGIGWKTRYYAPQTINSITRTPEGVNVSWDKASGVASYRLYRKPVGGSWEVLTTTANTSYIDKITKTGAYKYTLRYMDKDGNYISSYKESETFRYKVEPATEPTTKPTEVTVPTEPTTASPVTEPTETTKPTEVTVPTEPTTAEPITEPTEATKPTDEHEGKKYYEAVYKTVHHDAEFARYWVVDNDAYSYEEPVYKEVSHTICDGCHKDVTNLSKAELKEHLADHEEKFDTTATHTEIEKTYVGKKTVEVPQNGHYEYRQVKEAYDERVLVRPAGWYSEELTNGTEEYERTGKTYYEAVYKTVRHNAEIKRVWVVDQEAGFRDIPIYEDRDVRKVCGKLDCGLDLTNMTDKEINEHHMQTKHTQWRYIAYPMQVGTIKVSVSEQGHYENKVIKEAYDEQVLVRPAGWYLDESKYKTYHEAEYKTVYKDAEFEDVTIIDKETYTYEIPAYKAIEVAICKGCGCRVDTMTDEELDKHSINHMLNHEPGGYYSALIEVENGTRTVQAPAVTHTDKKLIKPESNKRILVKEAGWY